MYSNACKQIAELQAENEQLKAENILCAEKIAWIIKELLPDCTMEDTLQLMREADAMLKARETDDE